MKNSLSLFPKVNTDEEYETLKLDTELFQKAALEIVAKHHLPDEPLSLFEGTNIVFYALEKLVWGF